MKYTKQQLAAALGVSDPRINRILSRSFNFGNVFTQSEVEAILAWVSLNEHRSLQAEVPSARTKLRIKNQQPTRTPQ